MTINYGTFEYTVIVTQLVLAMLGMGATLTSREFLDIARRPHGVGLVLAGQYLLFPLLAFVVGSVLPIPVGVAIGLILVTAAPSGSISNIFAFLGRGSVPLSITATAASTLTCLIATPLILRLYAATYLPADFQMPAGRILVEIILYMLLPLAIGMTVCRYAPARKDQFAKWMIRGSLLALACLIVGSLGSGRIDLRQFGWPIPALIVAFGIVKITLTDQVARLLGFDRKDAFTMAIEVTVRNCNLALLLKASIFPATMSPDALGNQILYVVLFYGGAELVISSVPIFQRRGAIGGARAAA